MAIKAGTATISPTEIHIPREIERLETYLFHELAHGSNNGCVEATLSKAFFEALETDDQAKALMSTMVKNLTNGKARWRLRKSVTRAKFLGLRVRFTRRTQLLFVLDFSEE